MYQHVSITSNKQHHMLRYTDVSEKSHLTTYRFHSKHHDGKKRSIMSTRECERMERKNMRRIDRLQMERNVCVREDKRERGEKIPDQSSAMAQPELSLVSLERSTEVRDSGIYTRYPFTGL